MRYRVARGAIGVVIALLATLAPPTATLAAARTAHTNAVIDWNQTMLSTFAVANVPPPAGNRLGGIVQAAVFDAVNGIERRYEPIHVPPAGPPEASAGAAAINAAYTALVALFPAQKPTLDAALAQSLAAIEPDDGDSNSTSEGLAWGKTVANQILAWRAADFSPPPPYVFGSAPGDWQPTPGGSGPPKFRQLATTTPFALTSPSQFRPAGPPALTSARYAADLNEVRAFGGVVSTARSALQTETAKFWQFDTPTAIWDRVSDSLATQHHLNLLKSARLLALVDIALADATFAVWDAKNAFNFWRPVTAIVSSSDPTWQPLLTTPYFQEYPSAHSGVSSAAASILASVFGEDTDFTVTSQGLPGVQRTFSSFADAVAQVADARVFAGFHFRFSCEDGITLGGQVGSYVKATLMRPAKGEDGEAPD